MWQGILSSEEGGILEAFPRQRRFVHPTIQLCQFQGNGLQH